MATIVVQRHGWLGVKAESYIVLVDDEEIGRLGRRAKRVETHVDEGAHTVEVVSWGRSSGVLIVEAHKEAELLVDLVFPLSYSKIVWRVVRHRSGAFRESALDEAGAEIVGHLDVMRLVLR